MPKQEKSEEILDIVEKMPTSFGHWLIGLLFTFLALGIVICWFIKYPDTIDGEITINSSNTPVRLVATTNGQMTLLTKPSQTVQKGEVIAIIKNPAELEDILTVKKDLSNVKIQNLDRSSLRFPVRRELVLGDIEFKYVAFLSAYNDFENFRNNNLFDRQAEDSEALINEQNRSLDQKYEVKKTRTDAYIASMSELQGQGTLLNKKIISKSQYEQVRANHLRNQENVDRIKDEIITTQVQIRDLNNRIGQSQLQKQQKASELKVQLLATYKELISNIATWEQRYTIVAPIDGKLEFLQFWENDQFVNAGQELFSVVVNSQKNALKGEVFIPAIGLGKVKTGQNALIYLNDYPSNEYGNIEGVISNLSNISSTSRTPQGAMTYLNMANITLKHPNELITDHQIKIPFKPSMKGRISIITEDKRLLQRMFESIRTLTKKS
jgi:hypothetical protein